jgi:hypothetical protein
LGKKEKEEQRKLFQAKVDHVIMRLICVRGLIPHIIDSPEWKELMGLLNGLYHPTPSDAFSDKHIPSEAVFVREKQIKILRGINNLTLTFDGNTTRKPHSIYTVHATTPSRVTYFLDAHEGSSERHTQEWVTNKLRHVRYFRSLPEILLECSHFVFRQSTPLAKKIGQQFARIAPMSQKHLVVNLLTSPPPCLTFVTLFITFITQSETLTSCQISNL